MLVKMRLRGQLYDALLDVDSIEIAGEIVVRDKPDSAGSGEPIQVMPDARAYITETDPCHAIYNRALPGGITILAPVMGGRSGGYFKGVKAAALKIEGAVQLEAEQDNPHDPYAVAVYAPAGTVWENERYKLGYLPAGLAPVLYATLEGDSDSATVRASIAEVHANGRSLAGLDVYIETLKEDW